MASVFSFLAYELEILLILSLSILSTPRCPSWSSLNQTFSRDIRGLFKCLFAENMLFRQGCYLIEVGDKICGSKVSLTAEFLKFNEKNMIIGYLGYLEKSLWASGKNHIQVCPVSAECLWTFSLMVRPEICFPESTFHPRLDLQGQPTLSLPSWSTPARAGWLVPQAWD